jgi:putative transposase
VGEKTGKNPTDRGKTGVKRSVLCDGTGIPIGLAVDGANRHDMKLTQATLKSIVLQRPEPRPYHRQHLCLDKGYDFKEVRELVEEFRYTAHIKARGEEAKELRADTRKKARRWVVERTHSWLNRFRRILVRWEKKAENYIGLLHFVCGLIAFRNLNIAV